MDEDFITDGLDQNRYLKAYQLVTRFESHMEAELVAMCRTVRDGHPELFEADASLETRDYDGSPLRTIRTEARMKPEDDEGNTLTINVALEWVEPSNQPGGQANVAPDTFCYILYKIKFGSERVWEAVIDESRNDDRWDEIQFGEEKYDRPPRVAPGIVYIPVETGEEIVEALGTLKKHFTEVYSSKIQR